MIHQAHSLLKYPMAALALFIFSAACFVTAAEKVGQDDLGSGFQNPPPENRPWVYWFFMDGNMTREGMTADLEAMRDAGIGGAIFLEVDLGLPRGPVRFMSPEWRELFAHAVHEAERLGIEITLGTGPGWCGAGGPWVKPEQTMQHLVASETNVTGPAKFDAVLERPQPRAPFFGEASLTPELAKEQREFYRDVAVLVFPKPTGNRRIADVEEKAFYQRAPYSSIPNVKSSLPMPAEHPDFPVEECIPQEGVVELTAKMTPDGRLTWDVPPGEWTILRFVRTPTGQTTRPAPAPGLGFETSKFDPAAIDDHLEQYVGSLLKEIGPRKAGPGGLATLHLDSWEMSTQNWSEKFRAEFQQRRGYDPIRFLPAFTGRMVDNAETTERFLWDLRQTAKELIITNHAGRIRDMAHKNGLKYSNQPYDMNPAADLSLGAVADVPMGEFWRNAINSTYSVIEAASIGHTGGRPIIGAEAFTSDGDLWGAYPADIKALGDWAFAAGINRIVFHRYQHQPWLDRKPGMTMLTYGVQWERTQTWWPMVEAYHEYLARCQFLLRQGAPVADILFLAAEGAPHVFRPPPSATVGHPPDRREYNFDGCAPETLLANATVSGERIVFPGGAAYRMLVLPEVETMTPALLRKVGELVRAGIKVVGPPPKKSPGLSGFPGCDAEVQKLAAELWPEPASRGGVLWDEALARSAATRAATVKPFEGAQWIWFDECDPALQRDVTAKLQQLVDQGETGFPVSRLAEGDDPALGVIKTLNVSYRIGNELLSFSGQDPEPVQLSAGQVRIEHAVYGVSGNPAVAAPVGVRFFRRTLELPEAAVVESATIQLTADNGFVLKLNGQEVGTGNDFRRAWAFDLKPLLQDGANDLAICADNIADVPNPAGLIATVEVRLSDGRVLRWQTDRSWTAGEHEDSAGRPARELGGLGMAPWGGLAPNGGQIISTAYPEYDALAEVLRAAGVVPDFETDGPIRYTHRTADDTEIYFVANREDRSVDSNCVFRVAGRQPELWHPVTGERRDLPGFSVKDGRTTVPLHFEPQEAFFIVFRKPAKAPENPATNFSAVETIQNIPGPWKVEFDPKWGGPKEATFAALEDWSKRPEEGIRHYSGLATYRTTFDVPEAKLKTKNNRLFLDLGVVKNMAGVRVNGRDLGIVWCAPWRVEVTDVLKPGPNELEITVANLWINRLIADSVLPPDQRLTWASINPYTKDSPLTPSGLLGPVNIQSIAR